MVCLCTFLVKRLTASPLQLRCKKREGTREFGYRLQTLTISLGRLTNQLIRAICGGSITDNTPTRKG